MLLTYEEDDTARCPVPDPVADQWINTWWLQLVRTFQAMDIQAGFPAARSLAMNADQPIDLDTQPEPAVPDERDLRDLQLQEEQAPLKKLTFFK